jgi:mono/diheme cytochrome c family protein
MKSNLESTPCQLSNRLAAGALATAMTAFVIVSVGLLFPPRAGADPKPAAAPAATHPSSADAKVERGKYLVQIGGCNDCHTAGYAQAGGQTPTSDWLTGLPVGFRGPWGTSYPANLRLTIASMTENQWLQFARAPRLPPMPWFNLKAMNDDDLRSIYRFIQNLGPKGERVPPAAGPGQPVATPFIVFEPTIEQTLSSNASAKSK